MLDAIGPVSPVIVVTAALSARGSLAPQSLERFVELMERFGNFLADAYGVVELRAVTPTMVAGFLDSPCSDGPATVSVRHLRRAAVRMLFRVARDLGLAEGDPTLDLNLPARQAGVLRALTDDEVELSRLASVASLDETRLPAEWALAEATARTSELSEITGADIDLNAGRVWLHGASKATPAGAS
jgi:site-specific recombinase XerD